MNIVTKMFCHDQRVRAELSPGYNDMTDGDGGGDERLLDGAYIAPPQYSNIIAGIYIL